MFKMIKNKYFYDVNKCRGLKVPDTAVQSGAPETHWFLREV